MEKKNKKINTSSGKNLKKTTLKIKKKKLLIKKIILVLRVC